MRVLAPTLALLLLSLALAAPVRGAEPGSPVPPGRTLPPLPPLELRLRAATPRVRELLTTWESQERRLADLRRTLAAARDRGRAIDLERQIELVKHETDVALMRIQARHARLEGRAELADRLDAEVVRIAALKPAPAPKPPARPARPVTMERRTAEGGRP